MKNRLLFFLLLVTTQLLAQNDRVLPRGFALGEEAKMADYISTVQQRSMACEATPPNTAIRSLAEWEELQAIVITWTGFPAILTEIVRHAKEEVEVIIVCSNATSVQNALSNGGVDWSTNVRFVIDNFDSIWVRDYGPNTAYLNDVEELVLVDWIYNRPRPLDDTVPETIAEELGLPLYCTTSVPNDLVHTGGNYMSDGMGTGFSSRLILEENDATNDWGISNHSEADVDRIMDDYLGIAEYIKMVALPFDGISHIDMHMKILDEETLIVGQYPTGVADGPQIEANIFYILSQFKTPYGNPYKIVRIPMPPDADDLYPDDAWFADYRTYTNAIFINKTILVPTYEEFYDSTALRIWRENMPGYKVVGIDCNAIIPLSGAIHCITKEVGVDEPLLITHEKQREACNDEAIALSASIKHVSGVSSAQVFYRNDPNQAFVSVAMTAVANDEWTAEIPGQPGDAKLEYYIEATANSGKTINRPITAPAGFWTVDIEQCTIVNTNDLDASNSQLLAVFPNPASAITCIPVETTQAFNGKLVLHDVLGRAVHTVHEGQFIRGSNKFFIDAAVFESGTYFLQMTTPAGVQNQAIIIE
ncbi:MAG: agmatine deiminase family protein [Bacteroidota bacterium]